MINEHILIESVKTIMNKPPTCRLYRYRAVWRNGPGGMTVQTTHFTSNLTHFQATKRHEIWCVDGLYHILHLYSIGFADPRVKLSKYCYFNSHQNGVCSIRSAQFICCFLPNSWRHNHRRWWRHENENLLLNTCNVFWPTRPQIAPKMTVKWH